MKSWPWDLAAVLRQALGNPGSRAVASVLAAGLAAGESGAFFVVEDGDVRPVAVVPPEAPAGTAPVRALAARAADEPAPLVPGAPVVSGWPAACAVGTGGAGDARGALVVLSRDARAAVDEMRARAAVLAPVLAGLVALDRARRRARDAEARAGHLVQMARLAKPGRDLEEVGQTLLDVAAELAGADAGALWVRRGRGGDLELVARRHAPGRPAPRPAIGRIEVEPLVGAAPLRCPPSPPVVPRALLQDATVGPALSFPLHHDGELVGLLVVGRREGAPPFDEEPVARLGELAEAATVPMLNVCLRGQTRERARRVRVSRLLARGMAAGAGLEDLVRIAARELAVLVPFDALLLSADTAAGARVLLAERGRRPRVLPAAEAGSGRSLRRALVVPDVAAASRPIPALARELPEVRALLAVPLVAGPDPLGTLVLVSRTLGGLARRHIMHVRPVAELLAVALGAASARAVAATAVEERRRLQRRLGRAERDAVLGRLSSGLAHEIRNPLTVIGATVQYLRDRLPPEHAHRVLLDTADRKVREMDESLENLLGFTRPLELKPRPVALDALVAEIAAFVRPRAERQAVEVTIDAEPDLPPASLDPRLLERAILNLAQNALDAMPTGGRLGFGLRPASEGGLVLTLTDTGAGIEPAQLGTIFEPAFTTKRRGAGLGLAIARRIVEEHGGVIEAASEPGRGTTFTLRLPAAPPPPID